MGRIDAESETLIPTGGFFDVAAPLGAGDGSRGWRNDLDQGAFIPVTSYSLIAFSAKDSGADAGDISPTLRAGGYTNSHANGGCMPAVAFDARQSDVIEYGDKSGPLDTDGHTIAIQQAMQVRRLTPLECERLQGFSDNYTLIPYGKRRKPAKDGPRYKALGNSVAVPVMRAIGRRIQMVEAMGTSHAVDYAEIPEVESHD